LVLLKGFAWESLMAEKAANANTVWMIVLLRRKADAISFLNELMTGTVYKIEDPEAPPWFVEGMIHQVDRTLYGYYAESPTLRWADGHKFAYARDMEPFQFFWKFDGEYFGRQLSEEDTFRFCQLLDVKRYT